jgi:hypothetical protein
MYSEMDCAFAAIKVPKGVIAEKNRIKRIAYTGFNLEPNKKMLRMIAIGILWIRIPYTIVWLLCIGSPSNKEWSERLANRSQGKSVVV